MFDAWYNKITKNPSLKFEIGMSDTDSFLFKVSDGLIFRDSCKSFMDFSNYPTSHRDYSIEHKAQLGYFKDELCAKFRCLEFVGLRSKCYAMNLIELETNNRAEKKVCKGVGRTCIKSRLHFEKYKECLFGGKIHRDSFHTIRSKKHNLQTVHITKKALSFIDTKRWIYDCGVHSEPFGSVEIQKNFNLCPYCK